MRARLPAWKRAGASDQVLSIIREGVRLPFVRRPPKFRQRELRLTTPQLRAAWLGDSQQKGLEATYIANGAIRKALPGEARCLSACFLIPKKQKHQYRFIVDLRRLNKYLKKLKTRYGRLQALRKTRFSHAVAFDLADAYHHVGVHPDDQPFLGFAVEGVEYLCTALPFGLSISPAVFNQVVRVLKQALQRGYDPELPPGTDPPEPPAALVHYLDDFLLACHSVDHAAATAARAVRLCNDLGLSINAAKSTLTPTTELTHLGLVVDAATGCFRVSADRAAKLAGQAKSLLLSAAAGSRWVKASAVASFAGLAQSCVLAAPFFALRCRQLYTDLHGAHGLRRSQHLQCRLSHAALKDLKWFINIPAFFSRSDIWQDLARGTPVLYTDASPAGWGAVHTASGATTTLAGQWSANLRQHPIHVLELLAVVRALQALARYTGVRRRQLLLYTDNQAVMYMLRRWTTKCVASLPALHQLAMLLATLQLRLAVRYVRSERNVADGPSRLLPSELSSWQALGLGLGHAVWAKPDQA